LGYQCIFLTPEHQIDCLHFVLPAAVAAEDAHPSAHLPFEQQLVLMTEHVEAGMACYKEGKLDMVAPHLLHPASETQSLEWGS